MGIHCPGFGLLLDVEFLYLAGRLLALWDSLAVVPQSPTDSPGVVLSLRLEDGSIHDNVNRFVQHEYEMVPNTLGSSQTRRLGIAICEGINRELPRDLKNISRGIQITGCLFFVDTTLYMRYDIYKLVGSHFTY